MVRVLCPAVIIDMAGDTFLGFALIDSILMATGASERCVAARQRELRVGCMVKTGALPRRRVVAVRTGLRELRRFMIRIQR